MTLDDVINEVDIRELLHNFLVKKNLEGAKIFQEAGSSIGDGYLGVTKAVKIQKNNKIYKIFLKIAPKDDKIRKTLIIGKLFEVETNIYTKMIPIFDEFSQKKIGENLNLTPTCYQVGTTKSREFLIFEHLNVKNFSVFDKQGLLDEDHILLVLRSYAKFHGISFALKDQRPDAFGKIREIVGEYTVLVYKAFTAQASVISAVKTIKDYSRGKLDASILEWIEGVAGKFYELLEEMVAYDDRHKIVVHGDCWLTNMQFKYDPKTGKPIDLRFVDFQMSKVNLPVLDLSYFFYCCAVTQENLDKIDFYLEYYYKNLSEFLGRLGSSASKIYPYEIFMDDWKKFCRFGLCKSLILSRLILATGDDVLNVAEKIRSGSEEALQDLFSINLSNNDEYVERMCRILLHFKKNNYI